VFFPLKTLFPPIFSTFSPVDKLMDVGDVLLYTVEIISRNLEELVQINEKLEKYTLPTPNILNIKQDYKIVELLRSSIDLRLKIVEVLSDAGTYIRSALNSRGSEFSEYLDDLRALAGYYVNAGYREDLRIANKFNGVFDVPGLEKSIDKLYTTFTNLLTEIGEL
jgi:hypothetical protein